MREEGAYRIKVKDEWISAIWGLTDTITEDGYTFDAYGFKSVDSGKIVSAFDVQEVDENTLILR